MEAVADAGAEVEGTREAEAVRRILASVLEAISTVRPRAAAAKAAFDGEKEGAIEATGLSPGRSLSNGACSEAEAVVGGIGLGETGWITSEVGVGGCGEGVRRNGEADEDAAARRAALVVDGTPLLLREIRFEGVRVTPKEGPTRLDGRGKRPARR